MMINKLNIVLFVMINLLTSLFLSAQIQVSSIQEYDSLLSKLPKLDGETKLETLIKLGKYQSNKNPETGIDLLKKGLVIAKKLDKTEESADILRILGLCYDNESLHNKALEMYRISLKKARIIGDSLLIAKALHNIAFTYFKKEEYDKSIKYHLKNIKVEQAINDQEGLGYSYNHLGLIYDEIEEYEKADSCFQVAVKIREELKHLEGLAYTYTNLTRSYNRREKYDLSLKYTEKSLNIYKSLGDTIGYAGVLNQKGNILWYLDKPEDARKYYKKALDLYIIKKNWIGAIREYNNLAFLERRLQNFKLAESYILTSLQFAEKNKITHEESWISIYGELYLLAYDQKDYEKAFDYIKKYFEHKEKLAEKTSKEKVSDLESTYKLENKEAELALANQENENLKLQKRLNNYIAILITLILSVIIIFSFYVNRLRLKKNKVIQQKNEELEEKNSNLKSANEELNRFVYTVSHDLKAPLASVKGLIDVIRLHEVDSTVEEYLVLQEKSLDKLNLFITESLEYAKSSKKGLQIKKIKLSLLINEILEQLEHDNDSQSVKKEILVGDELEVYSDYDRIKSVLHNLITNSIRYRNRHINNSFVKILASSKNNKIFLRVEDNGIGMSENVTQKIFEKFYRANNKVEGTGLGLAIVKENVEKLNGNISIISEVGNGSTFKIMIPQLSEIVRA